jgi:hypothetical protein
MYRRSQHYSSALVSAFTSGLEKGKTAGQNVMFSGQNRVVMHRNILQTVPYISDEGLQPCKHLHKS